MCVIGIGDEGDPDDVYLVDWTRAPRAAKRNHFLKQLREWLAK